MLEFAASLPPVFKVQGKETKRVLKAAFARELPPEIIHRKKAGFPVPYEGWLRNGLNGQVRDLLLADRAVSRGYFKKSEINRLLDADLMHGGYSKEIFALLAVELWFHAFVDNPVQPAASTVV